MATEVVLAKRGDVLLQLSKNGLATGTLLVSSIVLALASPVFEAMFNGNFAEGQGLSSASPKKIALPEDDPKSMTLFCKIAHLQTKEISLEPSFDELVDLAIVCDKYQCSESVRPWFQLWIRGKLAMPKVDNFEKLVLVTYVCDLSEEFEQVTLAIMRDTVSLGDMPDLAHGSDHVPKQIFNEMRKQARDLHHRMVTQLYGKRYDDLLTSGCLSAPAALQCYLKALKNSGILMGGKMSLKQYSNAGCGYIPRSI